METSNYIDINTLKEEENKIIIVTSGLDNVKEEKSL